MPSQQAALFRSILAKAREELTTKLGQYMLFGSQLVGTKRVVQATATAVLEDKT